MANIGRISEELSFQLTSIVNTNVIYWPCQITKFDGSVLDRVYISEAGRWRKEWGAHATRDQAKRFLNIDLVTKVENSPSRLPWQFANRLYEAGETGMGYTIFTVVFQDGTTMPLYTGNAVDFVSYPQGQSIDTVADVLPHVGRDDPQLKAAPDYVWCLFRRY